MKRLWLPLSIISLFSLISTISWAAPKATSSPLKTIKPIIAKPTASIGKSVATPTVTPILATARPAPKTPRKATLPLAKIQALSYNLSTEPETIDPAKSTGVIETKIEMACFEGLMRIGTNDNPIPGAAERYNVSNDGKVYTFHLRQNGRWSNGDPVTAYDFVYAWKRVLDPKITSPYAYQLYYIQNAENFKSGKTTDAKELGLKVLNKYTLVITLENPCPYFLSILCCPIYYPVNKKTVETNPESWCYETSNYIGNGPFKLYAWNRKQKMEFVPNQYYWNRINVKLNKLTFHLITDQNKALEMFEKNELDLNDDLPNKELERLDSEGLLKSAPYLGTYFFRINVTKAPFTDPRVRKAIALAIDRQILIKYVAKGGQLPATAFVPEGVPDSSKKTFRDVGGSLFKDGDLYLAKKLLTEAGYPNGKGFPHFTITYNSSETHRQICEKIQEMLKENLGIDCNLNSQEWKNYNKIQDNLDYQLCRAGWIGDYVDPMTFLDLFTSKSGTNFTGWSNAEYDKLIATAKASSNSSNRIRFLHQAETLLMEEMPIIPIYYYTKPYVMKNTVKGIKLSTLGYVDFSEAYITIQ